MADSRWYRTARRGFAGGRQRNERGSAKVAMPIAAGLLAVATVAGGQVLHDARTSQPADTAVKKAAFGQLPLAFEANQGQTDSEVDFVARGGGYSIFVTPGGLTMSLTKRAPVDSTEGDEANRSAVVRMNLVGADTTAAGEGVDRMAGTANHLVGDRSAWRTGIPLFGRVSYASVYPGVDLEYYGAQGGVEYDFVIEPGADPSVVSLGFDGVQGVRLADNGDLVLSTDAGEVRQTKPSLYQEVAGRRQAVDGQFVLRDGGQVGFQVGAYDTTKPLVIDPVLDYSTFLGGSANDFGWGIAVDKSGRTYVGGETTSAVFPRSNDTPPGATKPTTSGTDAFILRMDAEGDGLDYVTFIGGSGGDTGQDLAIDGGGKPYLTGSTNSPDFPTTVGAFDRACGSDGACDAVSDHFVAKLQADGTVLQYATFLGGSGVEQHAPGTPYAGAAGLALKGDRAYLHSNTFSEDFPLTSNAFQTECVSCADGAGDGYLTVIDTSKVGKAGLIFSSYLGGDGDEQSKGVAVDDLGDAYVTGITVALAADDDGVPTNSFPVKAAYQDTYRGGYSDAYLAKVAPGAKAGAALVYSTFLGGGGLEEGWGVAVRNGQAYVTGYTTSGPDPKPANADPLDPATDPLPYFPTTAGAFDTTYGGRASTDSGSTLFLDGDAFVFVMNKAGTGPVWSTFVGGPSADYGQGIALDSAGQVYITGWTTCRQQDNRATAGNQAPPQFEVFEGATVPTGRGPGDPDKTGVGDCDGLNPFGINSVPAGTFPQINPIVDPGRTLNESAMDATYLGFELHNSPTGVFVTNLKADGSGADYSLLLDGPGFDRGFAIAVRDKDAKGKAVTPETYVTGRTGRQGYPVVASTAPGATLYDGTYNGSGRDTFISKLVG